LEHAVNENSLKAVLYSMWSAAALVLSTSCSPVVDYARLTALPDRRPHQSAADVARVTVAGYAMHLSGAVSKPHSYLVIRSVAGGSDRDTRCDTEGADLIYVENHYTSAYLNKIDRHLIYMSGIIHKKEIVVQHSPVEFRFSSSISSAQIESVSPNECT
jgi:hypothetical protein